ncbi:MAG TPA: lasso peptide biosynthesis B2 protein [Sphingomonadaceae bacterium]|nr:lasso peptide biosynthesis B2 protein [Sphingomonadaceae bacterium]
MVQLCLAQLLLALVPFAKWRGRLGHAGLADRDALAEARRLAKHVERGAKRLPFETSCLARAMALSRMLRAAGVAHEVVIAVRPPGLRDGWDTLHAWVELAGERVIGDLPGPWHETARLTGN